MEINLHTSVAYSFLWACQLVELGHKVPAVERWALGPDQSHSWKFGIRRPKVSRNPKPTLVDIGAQAGRPVFRPDVRNCVGLGTYGAGI